MAENLYIFGAGASVSAGAPVMNNFLDKAEDIKEKNPEVSEMFDFFFETRGELQIAQSKSKLGIDNLEEIFGAIEMAIIIEKLRNYSPEQIKKARESLIYLIVKTLEKSIPFRISNNGLAAPNDYNNFAEFLSKSKQDFSCITFNYDIALDVALKTNNFSLDYCLYEKLKTKKFQFGTQNMIKLLKPHGSINWLSRKDNKRIEVYQKLYRLDYIFKNEFIEISNFLESQNDYENLPTIIPPSWNKTQYQNRQEFRNVWKQSALEFQNAKNIYIIGFSLPETDSFFKYLFSLGTISSTRIRKLQVVNPDPNVKKNFLDLLGPQVESSFKFSGKNFENFIYDLKSQY